MPQLLERIERRPGVVQCVTDDPQPIRYQLRVVGAFGTDGPTLCLLCGCGGVGPFEELPLAADVMAARDRLLKLGCESCRVREHSRANAVRLSGLVQRGAVIGL